MFNLNLCSTPAKNAANPILDKANGKVLNLKAESQLFINVVLVFEIGFVKIFYLINSKISDPIGLTPAE